jgi:hypothetical protein
MGICRPIRSLICKDERATERIQSFQMTLRLRTQELLRCDFRTGGTFFVPGQSL